MSEYLQWRIFKPLLLKRLNLTLNHAWLRLWSLCCGKTLQIVTVTKKKVQAHTGKGHRVRALYIAMECPSKTTHFPAQNSSLTMQRTDGSWFSSHSLDGQLSFGQIARLEKTDSFFRQTLWQCSLWRLLLIQPCSWELFFSSILPFWSLYRWCGGHRSWSESVSWLVFSECSFFMLPVHFGHFYTGHLVGTVSGRACFVPAYLCPCTQIVCVEVLKSLEFKSNTFVNIRDLWLWIRKKKCP